MDAVEQLNTLVSHSPEDVPMRTTEELLQFFKNPPRRTYSAPLHDARTSVINAFQLANEKERRIILSKLIPRARDGFLDYAASMAVIAVRTHSPNLIIQGLTALVVEGGSLDIRDSIIVLAKLYHSAAKLGMNPTEAFEHAARLADPGMIRREMSRFPQRPMQDRSLEAFQLAEELTEEGFSYKSVALGNWPK